MCARLTQREMTKERDKARVERTGASEEENIYTEGRDGWLARESANLENVKGGGERR